MNRIHSALLTYLRDAVEETRATPLTRVLKAKTDEQIVRMMFMNYRGRETAARGLRLTNFGVQVMRGYFKAYEIAAPPQPKELDASELLYLDRKAKLPYHIADTGGLTMFDQELGIKLMLADGDITVLIEMDDMALTGKTV